MSKEVSIKILDEEPSDFDLSFKIILIGDSFVGKTCLSKKAVQGIFEENYTPTISFEFLTFYTKIEESIIKLQIWDTCGQEVYRSLISSFYHNSSLAILVYAIDNINSFENLETWINELKTVGNPDINIFLIGNKVDLEDKRKITKEMSEEFCKNHNISFFLETSAKTGFNVQNVFIEAVKILYMQHQEIKSRTSRPGTINNFSFNPEIENNVSLDEEESKKIRKKNCC